MREILRKSKVNLLKDVCLIIGVSKDFILNKTFEIYDIIRKYDQIGFLRDWFYGCEKKKYW